MAEAKKKKYSQEKAKRDLKIAEIVYYSIGGVFLALGFIFSIFGVILANPPRENFEDSFLLQAQTNFFNWLHWNTTFQRAGFLLMTLSILYFMVVFAIFVKKGDEVSKKSDMKKSRQRQVVFAAATPTEEKVVEATVNSEEENQTVKADDPKEEKTEE